MANHSNFPNANVAVALIVKNDREILWTMNENWGAFALPMTKRRPSPAGLEPAQRAAARAAAGVLCVPVCVDDRESTFAELKLSGRDGVVRHYVYEIFRVQPHPDFAGVLQRPDLLWLTEEQVFGSGFLPPISPSSADIITHLLLQGAIRRTQRTATVVFQRREDDRREFLLRWNPHWGFALPSKRREEQEPLDAAIERVLTQELQLQPGADARVQPSAIPRYTTFFVSPSAGVDTFYVHGLFDGELVGAKQPESAEADLPLVWASEEEVHRGKLAAVPAALRQGKAEPGRISPTVTRILSALDDIDWIQLDP